MRNRRLIGIARPRGQRGGRGRRDDRWGGGIGRSAGGRGIIDARVGRELRGGGCHFSSSVLCHFRPEVLDYDNNIWKSVFMI